MVTWSYGVTTVPSRFNTTLPKTLNSLSKAGFDKPRLFIDGVSSIPPALKDYEITQHTPRLRTFGNWITAAWELYIRSPKSTYYAIFQDDFITYSNLREYLEKCQFPKNGYMNLYTFPKNQQLLKTEGWSQSNQKGLGAVALVFTNEVFRKLLQSPHMVERPHNAFGTNKEWKSVDGAIVTALKKAHISEYVHNPSLVQHIGKDSVMDNKRHPDAESFRGESFDARLLLKPDRRKTTTPLSSEPLEAEKPQMSQYFPPPTISDSRTVNDSEIPDKQSPEDNPIEMEAPSSPSKSLPAEDRYKQALTPIDATGSEYGASRTSPTIRGDKSKVKPPRIGLVGYSCRSGLGELNRQLATYLDIDMWLIKYHAHYNTLNPPDLVDPIFCKGGNSLPKIEAFLSRVDVIIFCETPYFRELIPLAKKMGKKLIWIPMQEWAPEGLHGYPKEVDLTICPTLHCYNQFKDIINCVHVQWPIDLQRFNYNQRTKVEKFLFVNGHGGIKGRKGLDVVLEAKNLWPGMPLIIQSQVPVPNTKVKVIKEYDDNQQIYDEGDVLLNPAKVDGLGLQRLEALACGMPVISTDGEPWNESPVIRSIDSEVRKMKIARRVDWYDPNPESLVEVCKEILGMDISIESQAVREWAEENSWGNRCEFITNLIRSVTQ